MVVNNQTQGLLNDCLYPDDHGTYILPVLFHNFSGIDFSPAWYNALINQMNERLQRDNNGNPTPHTISLHLAQFDPYGGCVSGVINYGRENITPAGYNGFINFKFPDNSFVSSFQQRYVNIFIAYDIPGQLGGFSTAYDSQFNSNAIVVQVDYLLQIGLNGQGVFTHEFGHFLALYHTHADEIGVNSVPCQPDVCLGDQVATTVNGPSFSNLPTGCGLQPACNGIFDNDNLMTYGCLRHFDAQQHNRMVKFLKADKSYLYDPVNLQLTLGLTSNTISSDVFFGQDGVHTNITGIIYDVGDNVTIEVRGSTVFKDCIFKMGWDSRIIVSADAQVVFDNSKITGQCIKAVWKHILVKQGGGLDCKNKSAFTGANTAIESEYGASVYIDDCDFIDNLVSVRLGMDEGNGTIINKITNSRFDGTKYLVVGKTPDPNLFRGGQVIIEAYNCRSLFVDHCSFSDGYIAVKSHRNSNFIRNSTFTDCVQGIKIDKNYATGSSFIIYNQIFVDSLAVLAGGPNVAVSYNSIISRYDGVRLISPRPTSDPLFSFYNNNISSTHKDIYMKSPYKMVVDQNNCGSDDTQAIDIDYGVNSTFSNNILLAGGLSFYNSHLNTINGRNFSLNFDLKTSRGNIISDNEFLIGSDIAQSPSNFYSCNYMGNTTFAYNNVATTLAENDFDEQFHIEGGGGIISPQYNKGNDFQGTVAHYQTNVAIEANRFTVENKPKYLPETIDGPVDWFRIDTALVSPNACQNNSIWSTPGWSDEGHAACLDSLFSGTKYARMSGKQKWILLHSLYRYYVSKQKKSPVTLTACALNILNRYYHTNIGRLERLYDKIDSLAVKSSRYSYGPSEAALSVLVQQATTDPRQDIYSAWQNTVIRWSGVTGTEEMFLRDYHDEAASIRAEAQSIVSTAMEEPELYLAYMAGHLPAFILYDETYFTPTLLAQIRDLALRCADEVGEAKYLAGMVYDGLTGLSLPESRTDCQVPQYRAKEVSDPTAFENKTLYPNPTTGLIHLAASVTGTVTLYDQTGRRLMAWDAEAEHHTLDISSLAPGLYLLTLSDETGRPITHKIIKY